MQHFLNLDKCSCGAYRYLAAREHKKSFEIYLIHHLHSPNGQPTRRYAKLASVPKYRLNIHDPRINEVAREKTIKLSIEEISVLRSLLHRLQSAALDSEQREISEPEAQPGSQVDVDTHDNGFLEERKEGKGEGESGLLISELGSEEIEA